MGNPSGDETYLVGPRGGPPEAIEPLVERLRADQRRRWAEGDHVRVEAYLQHHSVLRSDADAVFALLREEMQLRQEAGETLQPDDYLGRWPQLADRIRALFAAPGDTGSPKDATRRCSISHLVAPADVGFTSSGGERVCVPGYEILGVLGRGGMGVVYKARQTKLNRLVALKMIRDAAHAGPVQRIRFAIEAEAVARLQHPHILQIHEVGEHDGCPYFSLEFLEGGSLSQRLAAGGPRPDREAAALVEQLAGALHYAHVRGIVHRDLKPGNVLLAADGTPKVADFGLAKLLDDASGQTQTGDVVGTPSYMAPEQADGRARDVGPATDVYALGAILYEVLTSRPPFRADCGVKTVLEVIHADPLPPSRLHPGLARDLETICLKCLAKDARKRYASAQDLADDLHRFLAGEPIHARPVGAGERLVKWARRRPALAALLAVSVVAAVALVSLGAWSNVELRRAAERERARAEEARAQRELAVAHARLARQAVNDMYVQVAEKWLANEPNRDPLQRDFLQKALQVYEELAHDDGSEETRRDIALAHFRLGQIYRMLEQRPDAEKAYERAIALQEALRRESAGNARARQDLANTWNGLGELYRTSGRRPRDAELAYRKALDLQQQLVDEFPGEPAYQRELARSHFNLGIVEMDSGHPGPAADDYGRAISRLTRLTVQYRDSRDYRQELARAYVNRGTLHADQGRTDPAAADDTRAISLLEALKDEEPAQPTYRYELAVACNNRGNLLSGTRRYAEALVDHRRALALLQELALGFSTRPVYRYELANTHNSLGAVLAQEKEFAGADQHWQDARTLLDELVHHDADVADYRYALGRALGNLGWLRRREKKLAEARGYLEEGIAHLRVAREPNPENPDYLTALRNQYRDLARTLADLGEHARAAQVAAELVGVCRAPGELLGAARLLDHCVAGAETDTRLSAAERTAAAQRYADQALDAIRQAVRQGYRDWNDLQTNPDLAGVRRHADLSKLRPVRR